MADGEQSSLLSHLVSVAEHSRSVADAVYRAEVPEFNELSVRRITERRTAEYADVRERPKKRAPLATSAKQPLLQIADDHAHASPAVAGGPEPAAPSSLSQSLALRFSQQASQRGGAEVRTHAKWQRTHQTKVSNESGAVTALGLAVFDAATYKQRLITGTRGANPEINLWEIPGMKKDVTLLGHKIGVTGVDYIPGTTTIVSAGLDKEVRVWDLHTQKKLATMMGHKSAVYCVKAYPYAGHDFMKSVVVTGGKDASVRLWDTRVKTEILCLPGHAGGVRSLALQPRDPQIVAGDESGTLTLWDLSMQKKLATVKQHVGTIRAVAAHPREDLFCSAARDSVRVWQNPAGRLQRSWFPDGSQLTDEAARKVSSSPTCMAIRDDGAQRGGVLVVGDDRSKLRFYDWGSGHKFQTLGLPPSHNASELGIESMIFDMTFTQLFVGDFEGFVSVLKCEGDAL